MSFGDPVERKDGIDDWLNAAVRQQRHDFLSEPRGNLDLLCESSCAQHGADHVKTFFPGYS